MKCEVALPNVLLFVGKNQYDISSSFVRLQEFYESPFEGIRGNYFTLEDYMDVYAEDRGTFSYFTDWNGFNVPGHAVIMFEKLFTPGGLSRKERFILDSVNKHIDMEKPFYVIGAHKEGLHVIDHELAHAMFLTYPPYRTRILEAVKARYDQVFLSKMHEDLLGMGYTSSVLEDEVQAYLATSSKEYLEEHFPNLLFDYEANQELAKIFREFVYILQVDTDYLVT